MSVKEYTKEFYNFDIRSGHVDDDVEKIARYINGLRSRIQDEIIFVKLETMEEAYQHALKAKEILTKSMNKDKELEVVDSREAEVDLMEKVVDLTILCRIKENLNGRVMIKARLNGKVVILTEEALILIGEEVIGPHKEDGEGSGKDPHDKGKAIAAEDKADSGTRDVYNNGLTLKVGLSNNDGSSKHMYAMNAYRGETSSNREHASIGLCRENGSYKRVEHASISLCREDGSYKRVEGKDESIFVHHISTSSCFHTMWKH